MTNQALLDFILTEIKQGATKESITKDLLGAGWDTVDIQDGFKSAGINTETVSTPTVTVAQPAYSTPAVSEFNMQNKVESVTQPAPAESPTFSTLDSYANSNPGNNPYSSPVYAGQVLQTSGPVQKSHASRNILMFVFVLLIVAIGGGLYAVKADIITIPNTSVLTGRINSIFNKQQPVAVVDNTVPVPTVQPQTVATVTPPTEQPPQVLPTADLQPLCTDIVCKTYFDVWKNEQIYQNNITVAYLNGHFVPVSMQIDKWVSGQSFSIVYDINIDWAKARTSDSFIIKTKATDKTYPTLNVRRGIYFSADEVRAVVNALAYNSQFTWFTPADHLFYPTRQSAIDAMQKNYPNNKLEIPEEVTLSKDGPKSKKEMFLFGYDRSMCATKNTAFIVKTNLFTGVITNNTSPCSIF